MIVHAIKMNLSTASKILKGLIRCTLFDDCSSIMFFKSVYNNNFDFLKYNKILTTISFLFRDYDPSLLDDLLRFRIRRYQIYFRETQNLCNKMERDNIDYLVIKTLRKPPKDISDIDLLIRYNDNISKVESILINQGYKVRKLGQNEFLWSKEVDGVTVDIELHNEVAAAGYIYYDKDVLFRNSIVSDEGVRTPSPIDDILLVASHSIMKDLYITLADVFIVYKNIVKYKVNTNELMQYADAMGLQIPLIIFLQLINILCDKCDVRALQPFAKTPSLNTNLIAKIVYNDAIESNFKPFRPNILFIVLSYFEKSIEKISKEGIFTTFKEIISIPQGKGLDAVTDYMFSVPKFKSVWE